MSGDLSENNIFICINHFREEDIVRVDRTLQGDGTYTEVPRITPTIAFYILRQWHSSQNLNHGWQLPWNYSRQYLD